LTPCRRKSRRERQPTPRGCRAPPAEPMVRIRLPPVQSQQRTRSEPAAEPAIRTLTSPGRAFRAAASGRVRRPARPRPERQAAGRLPRRGLRRRHRLHHRAAGPGPGRGCRSQPGGITVLQLAGAHPRCTAAIVMVDPVPFVFPPALRSAIEAMAAAIEAGNQEPRRQFIRDQVFLPSSDRHLVETVLEEMLAAPSHVAANATGGPSNSTPELLQLHARCRPSIWRPHHRLIRRI